MGDVDVERLTRLLGDPALEWLLARVRRRIELGRPLKGSATLRSASVAQRDAVELLLGRRPRAGRDLTVPLSDLDQLVRHARLHNGGLAAAVEHITGPVTVRADVRMAERAAWATAFSGLRRSVEDRPGLTDWVAWLESAGLVKRLCADPVEAQGLLDLLGRVVACLPAAGEPLARFAARVAGGAHALDDGKPLATLALSAARSLGGMTPPGRDESIAEWRREVWATVGLLCDELSNVVLTLGLPGDGETGSGRMLELARTSGQPVWLTLRQLVRGPPRWAHTKPTKLAGNPILICENPTIVALAADRFGSQCPRLVCTNGQPSAATMLLLRSLDSAGAQLHHHGDFEWGGIRIGNVLHGRLQVRPWRFDGDAFRAAIEAHPSSPRLTGEPVEAGWDPSLKSEMLRVGRRIEEELVADEMLHELAAFAGGAWRGVGAIRTGLGVERVFGR